MTFRLIISLVFTFASISSSIAQTPVSTATGKVIYKPKLDDSLFHKNKRWNYELQAHSRSLSINSGSSADSINSKNYSIEITRNCRILDSTERHYPFDSCFSYIENNLLVVAFINHRALFGASHFQDTLYLTVSNYRFGVRYQNVRNPDKNYRIIPEFQFSLAGATVTLKHHVENIGDRVMGWITVRCNNVPSGNPGEESQFYGPFDCIVRAKAPKPQIFIDGKFRDIKR